MAPGYECLVCWSKYRTLASNLLIPPILALPDSSSTHWCTRNHAHYIYRSSLANLASEKVVFSSKAAKPNVILKRERIEKVREKKEKRIKDKGKSEEIFSLVSERRMVCLLPGGRKYVLYR